MRYIDVVTGFFEGGKTSFIKNLINYEACNIFDKILVINYEVGIEKYDEAFKIGLDGSDNRYLGDNKTDKSFRVEELNLEEKAGLRCSLIVEEMDIERGLDESKINYLLKKYDPDYVIIEYNGMWEISKLVDARFEGGYYLRQFINIIDYRSFEIYIKNMEDIMVDKIINCDTIVFTKYKEGEALNQSLIDVVRSINKVCDIHFDIDLFLDDAENSEVEFVNKKITSSDREILIFGFIFFLINLIIIGGRLFFSEQFEGEFQRFIGIFISMLVQILPFLLIGSLLSGVIQLFNRAGKVLDLFKRTSLKSLFISLFIGVLFPVCDCGTVALARAIIRKGSSTPVVVTFLLASSSVNPIVILSTYYAFSGNLRIVIYKTFLGILISFLVGLILWFFGFDKRDTTSNISKIEVKNRYGDNLSGEGRMKIFEVLAIHLKNDFFKTGRYIILGSLVSASIQVFISKGVFLNMGSMNFISVFIMIIASFFISVCSTSNPFIARSFMGIMPQNSVLAFMVMGPMLDITNISVLSMSFKKRFLLFLVTVLIYLGVIVFSLIGGVRFA